MEISGSLPYSEQPMAHMQRQLHAEHKLQSIPILSSHRHLDLPCISKLSRTSTKIVYKLYIRRRRHGHALVVDFIPTASKHFGLHSSSTGRESAEQLVLLGRYIALTCSNFRFVFSYL
jgi:hypothetical protein